MENKLAKLRRYAGQVHFVLVTDQQGWVLEILPHLKTVCYYLIRCLFLVKQCLTSFKMILQIELPKNPVKIWSPLRSTVGKILFHIVDVLKLLLLQSH